MKSTKGHSSLCMSGDMKEGLEFTLTASQLPCVSLLCLKHTQKLEMWLLFYKQGFTKKKKVTIFHFIPKAKYTWIYILSLWASQYWTIPSGTYREHMLSPESSCHQYSPSTQATIWARRSDRSACSCQPWHRSLLEQQAPESEVQPLQAHCSHSVPRSLEL